jgi:hypothetical protein
VPTADVGDGYLVLLDSINMHLELLGVPVAT